MSNKFIDIYISGSVMAPSYLLQSVSGRLSSSQHSSSVFMCEDGSRGDTFIILIHLSMDRVFRYRDTCKWPMKEFVVICLNRVFYRFIELIASLVIVWINNNELCKNWYQQYSLARFLASLLNCECPTISVRSLAFDFVNRKQLEIDVVFCY